MAMVPNAAELLPKFQPPK